MKQRPIILITGATTGIGKSFVLQAAKRLPDSTIVIITRQKPDYMLPVNAEVIVADITDYPKVEKAIKRVLRKYGRIDVLVNNAGNGWRGMVEDTTITEAKAQLELNVWALMHITQQVLPTMRTQKSGHIINISSVAASIDYGTIGYYSATKAFLDKISRVLALEVAKWNIDVSVVAPGAVRTKFGHNMLNIQKYNKGAYAPLYKEWAHRFEVMFQKPLSSDVAANKIIDLIDTPRPYSFLTFRDSLYCYLRRLLSRRIFNALLLKRYMNL